MTDDDQAPEGWDEALFWLRRHNEEDAELTPELRSHLRDELLRRIGAERAAAPEEPSAPPPGPTPPARTSSAGRRAATAGLVAAAIVTVALILAVTGPTHPDPEIASESTQTTESRPTRTSLEALADRAAARGGALLGEDGAAYAHRVTVSEGPPPPPGGPPALSVTREIWVGIDGNGRQRNRAPGFAAPEEDDLITDGSLPLGGLTPEVALDLPTAPEPLLARLRTLSGFAPDYDQLGDAVVNLLAEAGLPPEVRAALIRGLDLLGFRAVDEPDGLGRAYEGPGLRGGTFVVVFDEDTVPRLLRTVAADGSILSTVSYSEVELRADLSD